MSDCVLGYCDGSGVVDYSDWVDDGPGPCPCHAGFRRRPAEPPMSIDELAGLYADLGRAGMTSHEVLDEVEPPPDLHARIMAAIRTELNGGSQ